MTIQQGVLFFLFLFFANGIVYSNDKALDILLKGYIYDSSTKDAIPNVSVYSLKARRGVNTDSTGFFSIIVPIGSVQLQISRIGYIKSELSFKMIGRDTTVNVFIEKGVEKLEEVVVTGSNKPYNLVQSVQMGMLNINQEGIKNIPTLFGEADVVKALQTQPGVSAGIEGMAGMYVRGGNEDENLYMLDGNPLYQVNHLGGLFSAFNTESIEDVDFYKSAFPARYGGRLSSIMNVHTQTGDMKEYHGSAMLGLTSGALHFEGPIVKDKTSFDVSLRRSWLDILSIPALAIKNSSTKKDGLETTGRYAFTDLNMKLNHNLNSRCQLYTLVYLGQDFLKGGEKRFSSKEEDDPFLNENLAKLRWGNMLVAAGGSYLFNEKLSGQFSTSYTRYSSTIQQSSKYTYGTEGSENYEKSVYDKSTKNGIRDIGLRTNFDYRPTDAHCISFGSDYTHHQFYPEYIKSSSFDNGASTNSTHLNEAIQAHEVGLYVEDDWALSSFLRINAGLRAGFFNIYGKSYLSLEPRVAARLLLASNMSLKASYSRMNQYVQQVSDSYISLPTDSWMPIGREMKPLVSDQFSTGLYYNLHNTYSFSVEGFYKWMDNLIEYKDGYGYVSSSSSYSGWENKLTTGRGRSYGAEFMARKEFGRLTGWVGYGLLWANRQFDLINRGEIYPAKYDNRHKINIVGNWKFNKKIEFNGSWTYMTGNRVTLSLENYQDLESAAFPSTLAPSNPYIDFWGIDYYDKKNNIRLPAYHRLDVGINIYCPKKNGKMGIWNISIYNAYCRMNPIVIRKSNYLTSSGQNLYPNFETLSIFPILPSISYTYKF